MGWLSEESLLLARNWDTIEDIINAVQRLREEMTSLLWSLESELAQHDWWQDGWVFVRHQETQVFISHQNWRMGNGFLVWIGVEMFTPEHVLGAQPPPTLYVWVTYRQLDLAQRLAEVLEEREDEVMGEIDHRRTCYVIRHAVQKCPPGEIEGYAEVARQQIIGFFAHYARILQGMDKLIQYHIKRLGSELPKDDDE